MDIERISVEDARRDRSRGALMVCAYEDTNRCNRMKLEGSIPLTEFRQLAPSLPRDREIIFYCA